MSYDDEQIAPWVNQLREKLGADSIFVCYDKDGRLYSQAIESPDEKHMDMMTILLNCVRDLHDKELDMMVEILVTDGEDGPEG